MSLVKYQLLLSAVETGSITGAAEEMGYTQSGVSHMLNSLEEELGVILINRSRNGVTLTSAGELLLPQIKRIVNENKMFMQTVSDMTGMLSGKIVIGSFPDVTACYLPDIISIFTKRYPGVQIEIKHGTQEDIQDWLERGKTDCGFVRMPSGGNLKLIPVYHDRLVAVCAEDRIPAGNEGDPLSADSLKNQRLIIGDRYGDYDYEELLGSLNGKTDILYAGDGHGAMEWVRRGLGVGIMPLLSARQYPGVKLFELDNTVERTIAFAYHGKRELTPVAERLVRIIDEYGKDTVHTHA